MIHLRYLLRSHALPEPHFGHLYRSAQLYRPPRAQHGRGPSCFVSSRPEYRSLKSPLADHESQKAPIKYHHPPRHPSHRTPPSGHHHHRARFPTLRRALPPFAPVTLDAHYRHRDLYSDHSADLQSKQAPHPNAQMPPESSDSLHHLRGPTRPSSPLSNSHPSRIGCS